jgi:peptidoglycan/LPS O-acetylase OafA/YrhL
LSLSAAGYPEVSGRDFYYDLVLDLTGVRYVPDHRERGDLHQAHDGAAGDAVHSSINVDGGTVRAMRPNIPPLTSLRFFAALVVVIFHYNVTRAGFPAFIADHGYEAVTFFFVLSGFILAYAHGVPCAALNIRRRDFFAARFVRICPAYYVAIFLIVLLFMVAGILTRISPWPTALVLSMVQSWTPQFALSLNPPAWSLSNEMFFYLLFPTLWSTTRYLSPVSSLVISVAMVLAVALVRIILMPAGDETWNSFRSYFPLLNLPQFILGVAIGYTFLVTPLGERVHARFFFAGLGALGSMVLLESELGWVADSATLCAVFGSIIFGAAGIKGFTQKVLSSPSFVFLGESSYAIYILHFPVWLWWNHYTRIVYQLDWPSSAQFLVYLSLVILVSITVLIFIERPARRTIRR